MGKISVSETKGKQRHNPLLKDISSLGGNLRATPRSATKKQSSKKGSRSKRDEEVEEGEDLTVSKGAQDELKEEEENVSGRPTFAESFKNQEVESDEEAEEEYSDMEEEGRRRIVYDEEEIEVDEKDAELFNKYFQSNGESKRRNPAQQQLPDEYKPVDDAVLLPPKVILAYEKIGQILSTYTHGKLPKLFKILPSLKNWEDVLYVTNPDQWTPHATYEATKLFVSNLQANEAQKFIEKVLLEKFRTSIEDSDDHSLNYHIYRALKKSLYKPGAFFKGFLLPLVDGYCSVREATIAASVLTKVSVPVLHSSVALTQLLQRDFSPATTVFIRVLIEKKYALPYQTLDELVFYFMRFRNAAQEHMELDNAKEAPQLPVVWHKAFLAFAQRYKNDITDDQRDFLLETVRQRFHHSIGPEIRRELLAGKPRLTENDGKEGDGIMIDAF
ncbi:Essential nuclear protein 1 [Candida viswanathii]|uniref:Essential nuclear protein 1 n=1 Tax=Candida viswanathii TaxID=5486 RepID=A0A367YKW5_9ASCO|nr:Essential nuclear protein 1 [Candida viswanathii]